jgi:urease accessory protein
MRQLAQWLPAPLAGDARDAAPLPLDLDARRRSRQRLSLPDGTELALALPVGTVLHEGDLLLDDQGARWRVVAKPQPVLLVRSEDACLLQRAAYHLGNRHVPVAVLRDALLLEPDPVLSELLERLGLRVDAIDAPFEPESGAYGGGHRHGHDATFAQDHALAQAVYSLHDGASATAHPHVWRKPHG